MNHNALTVLIVEDDETIRTLLQMELEEQGFTVVLCSGKVEAQQRLDEGVPIDVALLDLRLGDGSGMDVLKSLHNRNARTPVIMMTGHGNKNVILEALKLGVFDYLEKPFSVREDLFPVLWRAQSVAMLARENSALLSEARHQAKLAALGEVSAMVMHDIRGPLSTIQLSCEDMLEEAAEAAALSLDSLKSHVEVIDKSCQRIQRMVEHLRAFSRNDAQESSCDASIQEIADAALFLVQRKVRDLKVDVKKEIAPALLGATLFCPQNGMEQALMNLLSNACDAMSGCQTRSLLLKADVSECGEYFQFTVSDTGIGMSAQTIEKLYQAYFTTKESGRGTGLGVKITRDTVERLGGGLLVSSTEGVGSSFVIRIPVARLKPGASAVGEGSVAA